MGTIIYSNVIFPWFVIVSTFYFSLAYAKSNFTEEPPQKSYAVSGADATFIWDYDDNISSKFDLQSPRWDFYGNTKQYIGYIDRYNGMSFKTGSTCPDRLTSPTLRVVHKPKATLVIKNVTSKDDGIYGCTLVIFSGTDITSKTTLFVTKTPTFTDKLPASTTVAIEKNELNITCTATGPPPPNITWVNVTNGETLAKGVGSAILRLKKIQRSHKGLKYRCEANNNPNEQPVDVVTTIEVYYAPEIKSKFVKKGYCIEDIANITVSVDGNPKPTITCKHGLKKVDPKVFPIKNDDEYGNYTCKVTNEVGSVTYVVQLIKTNTSCQPPITKPTPAPSVDSVHPGIIAGAVLAAILLIVGVVIGIIFWRRRKTYKRDSTTSHNQTVHMNDLDDGEEQYATAQHANRAPAPKEEPTVQYAVVDKSKKKKKKQPGELIYADLDHEATTPSDRPPSDRRPTGSSDQDTVYADINRAQEETPRYGNLQQMDNM